MRTLHVVLASVVLLSPHPAAGQAIPPVAEPLMQSQVEAPPFFVVQAPPDFPTPSPGAPQLGPGGPAGPGPLGPPRPSPMIAPGPGAWWRDSEIVKTLGLSETQVARIEQAYLAHRLRLVDLRADLEKREIGLQPLLNADSPDESKVTAQLDLITTTRGRLEKEHALMLLAIRRELSVEQWKRLQMLQQERAANRHAGLPMGLPGGPSRQSAPAPLISPPPIAVSPGSAIHP